MLNIVGYRSRCFLTHHTQPDIFSAPSSSFNPLKSLPSPNELLPAFSLLHFILKTPRTLVRTLLPTPTFQPQLSTHTIYR